MRAIGLVALLVPFGAAAAALASDGDVLKQFGMLGRVAIDCSAPASLSNPHVTYAVSPQGDVTRTLKMSPDLGMTFPMRNLRLLGPGMLQFEETGRQSVFTVIIAKVAGKFRSWHSVRTDGTVVILDGRFHDSGESTVAFEFCPR